jgi:putative transposase
MRNIEHAKTFDEAYTLFIEMAEKIKSRHPHFSKELKAKAEYFVTFTHFPEEIRSRLKSTNASENLHKELEKIRLNTGGYFQSKTIGVPPCYESR